MRKKLFLAAVTILVSALPASWGEEKVTICHFPPGNPENVQIITIGASAVPHHIANHGDRINLGLGDSCGVVTGPPNGGPGPG